MKKMINTINLNMPCVLQLRKKKKSICEGTFEVIILKAVDEIFSSFGRSCKQSVYSQLDHTFKIKKQEIPVKIAEFADALEQFFGTGAKFIELKIIEKLHKKIPNFIYSPKMGDLMFADYVENLRRFFLITSCKGNKCLHMQRKRKSPQLLQNNPYFLLE
jgi:hypothetical protein